jgi:predicted HicB family RNase H-like nuclease
MTIEAEEKGRKPIEPIDVAVQLNVKVPYHYRQQLMREAKEKHLSLNRYVVNGLVRAYPPERR